MKKTIYIERIYNEEDIKMEKQVAELVEKTSVLNEEQFYEVAITEDGTLFYDVPISDVNAYDLAIHYHSNLLCNWTYVGKVFKGDTIEDVLEMIKDAVQNRAFMEKQ